MKFLVTVKRVTDYEAKIKLKADKSGIVTDGVNMITVSYTHLPASLASVPSVGRCGRLRFPARRASS